MKEWLFIAVCVLPYTILSGDKLKGTSKNSLSAASGCEVSCASLRSFTETQRIRFIRAPGAAASRADSHENRIFRGTLNVVASIPDLGDMAGRIGGDKVNVTTLATGRENLHAVPVRPSFLPILNKADLLLTLGLDAEHAWLPALAADARNPDIMEGRNGWIETSRGIPVLDIPEVLDRSEGEQHPEGNPHYNIGPQCGAIMARNLFDAFASVAPKHKEYFALNLARYVQEIDSTVALLKKRSAALRGITVIDYHPDVSYLCAFYGMEIIGHVEPKAGVAPTAAHLRELEALGNKRGVRLIIHNQSQSPKIPQKLGRSLGCPVVEIANAVGAKKGITSWLALQEYNNRVLIDALGAGR